MKRAAPDRKDCIELRDRHTREKRPCGPCHSQPAGTPERPEPSDVPGVELRTGRRRIAVPVDVQVHLAENRRALAEARYELSVRRGRSWIAPTEK